MSEKAVALLSGGLDSMLAIRVMQEQGIDVHALNFQTIFTCCKNTAAQAAHELGVPLTVLDQQDDYIELVRKPKYGYGKGANPCIDCRIYMFRAAKVFAEDCGASFIVSGEVLGQRPMSQKRRQLSTIAYESGLDDTLLRPLSARMLPPTEPERTGIVDRSRLFGFVGRGRKELISLARHYGLKSIPSPSTGCALTEKSFAGKVHDLVQLDPASQRWDFELLNVGRHLRFDGRTKVVVGRRGAENVRLVQMYGEPESRATILMQPDNFSGPTLLVIGPASEEVLHFAGGLMLRYSKHRDPDTARVLADVEGDRRLLSLEANAEAELAATL